MFRGQNYENAFTLNILYLNISDIDISGFGRNSDSDMRTFRNCDVKRFETQTWANISTISTISEQIFRRRLKFIGHVLRMDPNKHPKTALTWAPEGRRSRGRPKETWRRTTEKERTALGFISWSEATVAARDRATWRRRVSGPIPT